jgi:hypothetical protein
MILTIAMGLPTRTVANPINSLTTLAFGTTIQDALGVPGEEDDVTFSANAGDVVLVRMSRVSGSVRPYVRVLNAGGATLCTAYSYGTLAEIATCMLPETATYTLRAADYYGSYTGNYALYIQRLNAPGATTSRTYGATASGSITTGAQLNTYTFDGAAGEKVVVHAATTSGDLDPKVRVYDPEGVLRCQTSDVYTPVLIDTCAILVDGTHTILIGDDQGTDVGVYNLHLQRLTTPVGGIALPDAQVRAGTVTAAAELDAYTFSGAVGDKLLLRVAPSSAGGLDPELRIYDPNGARVCTVHAYDRIAEIDACTLATAGTHTLLIGDYGGGDVGNYDVVLVRLTAPSATYPLAYGTTQVRAPAKPVELHAYTFQGRAGEVLAGQAGVPGGGFDPHLRLYGTDGVLICQDYAYTQYSFDAAYVHCILPSDQMYTALIGAYDGSSRIGVDTYNLHVQRLNPPVGAVMLRFDAPAAATINPAGEWDAYTFRAASGDVVTVRMSAEAMTIDPQVRLFGTDGVKLCEAHDYSSTYSDAEAVFTGCTLPFSGTYTLLAGTYGAKKTGGYTLRMSCDGDACGFPLELNKRVYLPLTVRSQK